MYTSYLNLNLATTQESLLYTRLGISRLLLSRVSFGADIYLLNQTGSGINSLGIGIDLGLIFRLPENSQNLDKTPLSRSFGFSLMGLGLQSGLSNSSTPHWSVIRSDWSQAIKLPGTGIRAGYNQDFLRFNAGFHGSFSLDVHFGIYPLYFYSSIGVKYLFFNRISLLTGIILGNNGFGLNAQSGIGFYTAGLSYKFEVFHIKSELFYSYNPIRLDNTSQTIHFLGLEMSLSSINHKAKVTFQISPPSFSPDDDGRNDTLHIQLGIEDKDGIRAWKLEILDPDNQPFKTFSGNSEEIAPITWNGISDNGELVESAQNYPVRLTFEDRTGKTESMDLKEISVDVLVQKTAQGLSIQLNTIEFETASSTLTGDSFTVLNRVAEILNAYSHYSVEIHGHTDNLGNADGNLRLSKNRAEAVKKYLVQKKKIQEGRIKTMGFGMERPIADNSTETGRRKNRRVELVLIKE